MPPVIEYADGWQKGAINSEIGGNGWNKTRDKLRAIFGQSLVSFGLRSSGSPGSDRPRGESRHSARD